MKSKQLLSIGSCFSAEIGNRLSASGENILVNPFGVLYNPMSIAQSLRILSSEKIFTLEDVVERDPCYCRKRGSAPTPEETAGHRNIAPCTGGYVSFFHHGSFTRATPEEFLKNANAKLATAREFFQNADCIIITFGTAKAYVHKERNCIVSNCHKHLAEEFSHLMLPPGRILKEWNSLLDKLDGIKARRWIFTVSPVQHLKDGIHENQISKSTLLLVCEELLKNHPSAEYFPSYEIMMNDAHFMTDGSHPSEEAVNIIFKRFTEFLQHP